MADIGSSGIADRAAVEDVQRSGARGTDVEAAAVGPGRAAASDRDGAGRAGRAANATEVGAGDIADRAAVGDGWWQYL